MPESRVDAAIAEFLQAAEAGTPIEREAWLARYPDLRPQLEEFLRDRSAFQRAAESIDHDKTMAPREEDIATAPMTVRYFGDYELQQEIARGGMGVVWKARQVSLNRPVALKMILAGQLASPADGQLSAQPPSTTSTSGSNLGQGCWLFMVSSLPKRVRRDRGEGWGSRAATLPASPPLSPLEAGGEGEDWHSSFSVLHSSVRASVCSYQLPNPFLFWNRLLALNRRLADAPFVYRRDCFPCHGGPCPGLCRRVADTWHRHQ